MIQCFDHSRKPCISDACCALYQEFPSWESVLKANTGDVADAIRVGGLADIKANRIQSILSILKEERPGKKLSLEYVRKMTDSDIKEHLGRFKGVGYVLSKRYTKSRNKCSVIKS